MASIVRFLASLFAHVLKLLSSIDSMKALCCMSFLGKSSSEILVAGCQNVMFKIDIEQGRITEEVRE